MQTSYLVGYFVVISFFWMAGICLVYLVVGTSGLDLVDDERKKGVQIVRVAVKIAGRERQMRYRIMPDPKDDEKCYICRKEPESEEMVPVVHRGAPRYVERSRDGSWELV